MEFDKKIAPCPYSRQYLIDARDAWASLTVYFLYRLALGSALVFLFFLRTLPSSLGGYDPELYAVVSSLYLGSTFVSAVLLFLRRPSFSMQGQSQIFADLAMIPLIMHASGGIGSGVGMLLVLTVAAGGLLIGGRCALLFAALASLAVLAEEVYGDLTDSFPQTHLTYAGMLGTSYFAIAILAVVMGRRAEQSEAVATQRGIDLANLEQLNAFVIHHLQSGILVIDEYERIRMLNEAAGRLLGVETANQPLELACPDLAELFHSWLKEPANRTATLKSLSGLPIQVRFNRLGQTLPPIHMAFLEDAALYAERVQQSKLVSLGRLTASIAHEIRNPLAAISHAGQLLAECPQLSGGDLRLTQIILDHVGRVNRVIENVLQLSRKVQSTRDAIPLAPAVTRLLRDFQAEQGVADGTFRLKIEAGDVTASVNFSHLKQILENLCSNALKYGHPEQGAILIQVIRERGEPCVEFHDHAPPIDARLAEQMFEPFFTTSASGTGLGLYIARELAELNQARLEYAMTEFGGHFRLYLQDAEKTVVEL